MVAAIAASTCSSVTSPPRSRLSQTRQPARVRAPRSHGCVLLLEQHESPPRIDAAPAVAPPAAHERARARSLGVCRAGCSTRARPAGSPRRTAPRAPPVSGWPRGTPGCNIKIERAVDHGGARRPSSGRRPRPASRLLQGARRGRRFSIASLAAQEGRAISCHAEAAQQLQDHRHLGLRLRRAELNIKRSSSSTISVSSRAPRPPSAPATTRSTLSELGANRRRRPLAADRVDGAVLRRGDQPRGGIVRQPAVLPDLERVAQGVLDDSSARSRLPSPTSRATAAVIRPPRAEQVVDQSRCARRGDHIVHLRTGRSRRCRRASRSDSRAPAPSRRPGWPPSPAGTRRRCSLSRRTGRRSPTSSSGHDASAVTQRVTALRNIPSAEEAGPSRPPTSSCSPPAAAGRVPSYRRPEKCRDSLP